MEKILTVSIAAYNAEKDLEICLNSMLQTSVAEELEIIVVNDGSKDTTAQIARKYVEKYPHIVQLIDKENGGHGSTINASIRAATAKYYKVVDSDDWVEQQAFEQLVETLRTTRADLILNPFYTIDAKTRKANAVYRPFAADQLIGTEQPIQQTDSIDIAMHAITFRTEMVKKMGSVISENCFYVDMEYTLFPIPYVQSVLCLDFPVYCYLLGTATQSMNVNTQIKRRDQHLHVLKRIVAYYLENEERFYPNMREIVLRRIQGAALSQYKIYFNMTASEAKPEIMELENWIKTNAPEVYVADDKRFARVLNFNRKTNFRLLGISIPSLKLLHRVLQLYRNVKFRLSGGNVG